MTTLREPFATVHKKDIKNKEGAVVAQVDYIGWSQSADRLDEASEVARWSFYVVQLGADWALGDLAIWDHEGRERHYQNVGYAENAEMAWKKEPLKDAVSDAFKRCAALAGVARYLYDKDTHSTPVTSSGRGVPSSPPRPPAHLEDDPTLEAPAPWDRPRGGAQPGDMCDEHGEAWRGDVGDLYHGPKPYHRHPDNVRKARGA